MRIAVVHGFYSANTPSGENAVVEMQVACLKAAGHTVELIAVHTDDFPGDATYKMKTALRVASGYGEDPSGALRAFVPDIIHVHNLFPNFSTRWLDAWEGPIVTTLHNFRPMCASGNLFRSQKTCTLCPTQGQIHGVIHKCYKDSVLATAPIAFRNRGGLSKDKLLRRAEKVVVLSERAKNVYLDYGMPSFKMEVIPNFTPAVDHRAATTDRSQEWVYAGRLTEDKGILPLVKAWPAKEKLSIYGDGPEMEPLLRLGHPSVVMRGAVSRQVVSDALKTARGVVIPSLWAEGMPTIYLEALAAGLPVLAKSGNSAADDVLVSKAGHVFEDFEDVPESLDRILMHYPKMQRSAEDRFARNFTAKAWLKRIETVYQEVHNAQ